MKKSLDLKNFSLNNKNYIYLIFSPIVANFLLNSFREVSVVKIQGFNYYNLFSTLLLFLFLFYVGKIVKLKLNLPYKSAGIVAYLLSFFIIDNIILFFYTNLNHSQIFIFVNLLWMFFLIYKKTRLFDLFVISSNFIFLNLYNVNFLNYLTRNKNIIGDVKDVHFEHVKNIYLESYFSSMNSPVLEGYPQFIAYFQAVLNRISISQPEFEHLSSSINVLYFLTILLIYEINLSDISKFTLSAVFTSLIFNSDWLQILFVDSLMAEGSLSYIFCTILISLTDQIKKTPKSSRFIFLLLGFLYLSKQFISILTLLIVIYFILKKLTRRYALFGLIGFLVKELSYESYFSNLIKNYHMKEIDYKDTVLDLLLFRDVKFENLRIILDNLYIDKPISIIFLIFFITVIVSQKIYRLKYTEVNFFSSIILINYLLIFTLYISIWRNMELESPIRYMLNLLHLNLFTEFYILNDYVNKNTIMKNSTINS
tara:strand:+ start:933 stop:2378 length:1446 start_codon:yes stop_codon:yes gene_type:complete